MDMVLIIAGSAIFGFLGSLHLLFTFFTNKCDAYDSNVTRAMKKSTLVLTKQTTMWNAWVGFNASHSVGAMLVAAFFIPLLIYYPEVIRHSLWFSVLPSLVGFVFLVLAKKYWFNIPLMGIVISTLCFVGAALLMQIK